MKINNIGIAPIIPKVLFYFPQGKKIFSVYFPKFSNISFYIDIYIRLNKCLFKFQYVDQTYRPCYYFAVSGIS